MSTASSIRQTVRSPDPHSIRDEVRQHLNDNFPDLDTLHPTQAGPSTPTLSPRSHVMSREGSRRSGKKRRGLKEEIEYWEQKEYAAAKELEETSSALPGLLQSAQERLAKLLDSAQELSIERYALADKLANLISELDSAVQQDQLNGDKEDTTGEKRGKTVLEQMEVFQDELSRLEVGLVWVTLLEQVLAQSEKTLAPTSHRPSPLAALPHYKSLHRFVDTTLATLPPGMGLTSLISDVRDKTWAGLKDIMSQNLLKSLEPLKWPLRVDYASLLPAQRRSFERAYQDLLYLQAEGENLGIGSDKRPEWYSGDGLYPLQAMVQPISLRFRYHFQGSRDTNRIDKPEWAFTNISDQIYEHQQIIEEYLQPLTRRAGYDSVDVKSEFVTLLFPILLSMLRSRIPHLLDRPALLAHTIYQTVVFDDNVRETGYDFDSISINEGLDNEEWEGLTGVLLKQEGWYQQWLAGEKKFAEGQLQDIISSPDAWTISEEIIEGEDSEETKPTVSARQVKALIEQITDRYSPLPTLSHRIPFVVSIQLPLLASYLSRISGSLDAFETLSSAFVRAVPGALSGNTRGGVHVDQTKLTGGKAGLERLIKAGLSAGWVLDAMRGWADDVFFVEMSDEVAQSAHVRWSIQNETLLPLSIRSGSGQSGQAVSIFDTMIERFEGIAKRVEDMIVRHISVEVENDLKQHLTRRWDRNGDTEPEPDSSLLNALTTFSTHLTTLSLLPPVSASRVYRKVVQHIVNHISQRVVYAGWSKFTQFGGRDFAVEIRDWIVTSGNLNIPGGTSAIEAPWGGIRGTSKILALPSESSQPGDPTFAEAMAVGWAGEESLEGFCRRVDVRLGREELQGVLRRRVDCWR